MSVTSLDGPATRNHDVIRRGLMNRIMIQFVLLALAWDVHAEPEKETVSPDRAREVLDRLEIEEGKLRDKMRADIVESRNKTIEALTKLVGKPDIIGRQEILDLIDHLNGLSPSSYFTHPGATIHEKTKQLAGIYKPTNGLNYERPIFVDGTIGIKTKYFWRWIDCR
ncbi:MAG: hypothetical protein R3F11_09025 [Verrucomicrobiales bacterium]